MLSIYFGNMPKAIYNTAVYFKNTYRDSWITHEDSVRMIKDVDRSDVISANAIQSPVLGTITPLQLSGGVKTLMLIRFDHNHVFNASTCGDNCAKWILSMAQKRKVVINLHHVMDFGEAEFKWCLTTCAMGSNRAYRFNATALASHLPTLTGKRSLRAFQTQSYSLTKALKPFSRTNSQRQSKSQRTIS